jgi:hypothetical protein
MPATLMHRLGKSVAEARKTEKPSGAESKKGFQVPPRTVHEICPDWNSRAKSEGWNRAARPADPKWDKFHPVKKPHRSCHKYGQISPFQPI